MNMSALWRKTLRNHPILIGYVAAVSTVTFVLQVVELLK